MGDYCIIFFRQGRARSGIDLMSRYLCAGVILFSVTMQICSLLLVVDPVKKPVMIREAVEITNFSQEVKVEIDSNGRR